jgi:hypothetical protein
MTGRALRQVRGAEVMADDALVIAHQVQKLMALDNQETGVRVRLWTVDPGAERAGWVPVAAWPSWRYVRYEDVAAL